MLHDCGVKCKHLVYNFAAHADFVVTWKPRPYDSAGTKQVWMCSSNIAIPRLADSAVLPEMASTGMLGRAYVPRLAQAYRCSRKNGVTF